MVQSLDREERNQVINRVRQLMVLVCDVIQEVRKKPTAESATRMSLRLSREICHIYPSGEQFSSDYDALAGFVDSDQVSS